MAEYAYLSTPDPEIAEDLRVMSENQDGPMDNTILREYLSNVLSADLRKALESELPSESKYDVKDFMFDTGDGSGAKVLARNIVPAKSAPDEKFPLFFWIHGGGWVAGDVNMDDPMLRIICANLRISVVNCEYRLSPEHVFPTALNDCYAVLKHVAGNPDQFSASLEKGFIIGGASAGGNLSAALALRLRDDPFFKEKPLTGQSLIIPMVIHPDAYSELPEEYRSQLLSMEQNKNAPGSSKESVYKLLTDYQGPPKDPYMSPLLADSHKGLPPAFIQVAGLDPLRDEAFVYEKVLNKNGVSTKLIAYPGVPHSGWYIFATKEVGKKWRKDWQDGIQWLLGFSSKN